MNGHPRFRWFAAGAGQNPAYRPSGAVRGATQFKSYILCLPRNMILLISNLGYFPRIGKGERGVAAVLWPVLPRPNFAQNEMRTHSSLLTTSIC